MKHIHFIGICGVAMSALAIAFHKKGYRVTGSDKGFYPPVSTHLKNAGVEYYPGWHIDKMTAHGDPDLVIVGNVAGSKNPEWLYVQENNLTHKSYPEAIAEFFVKENSIVCAGTYGKTTTSALLTWIFLQTKMKPSYMFGGLSLNNINAAQINENKFNISVLEGDEYKTARWDNSPKFSHYSPTHLLLTSLEWDHADIYKTEQSYIDAFEKLVESIPATGNIVACMDHPNVKKVIYRGNIEVPITYGAHEDAQFYYSDVEQTKDGIAFFITHGPHRYYIQSPLLGVYMAENITGCFAMARQFGLDEETIIDAIASFKGLKRRLEKRYEGAVTVFDDIAHSPAKAASVLKNLRSVYTGRIIAVFEPNTGNRQVESTIAYKNAFADADEIIIPRLTKIKMNADAAQQPFDGAKLAEVVRSTHKKVTFIEDDSKLVEYLVAQTKKDDVIVFLGSHGFRGMIEEVVKKLS